MDIEKILQQMTLEEKADFCSGSDFWHTQPVERLGVPAVMMSDGPSGLRKQDEQGDHLGINESIPAVCFPSSAAVASSGTGRVGAAGPRSEHQAQPAVRT